jgi:hypothetical protein
LRLTTPEETCPLSPENAKRYAALEYVVRH